ncbi:MAG: ATP-dependent zinc metalloprotease FtsH [Mycoplasmataceae bacterium]|nr:MAG: ATP-dependent zinc metalloprotease FtsH [Mycoplasmataceae bacterium]
MEITELIKKLFLLLFLGIVILLTILLGQKYLKSEVNITTPKPNVEVKNIIDLVSPWKKPPKYVAYTAEETKNFKNEELILSPEIQSWYKQAKIYPSRAYNAIFYGTPMTGKTSLARQLAKEAGLPFVAVKGDDLKDRLYEQRTTKDKFEALLEDLKTNPKTQGQNYILFVDEANHVGDKLNSVKDLLAQVDDKLLPNNLWIFATNYIEEIDKAVYENKERLRYKLDFSWNKNTFLDYAQQNDLSLVQELIPTEFGKEAKVLGSETIGSAFKKIGSKSQVIYKKFNFESLNLLKSHAEQFFSYWERIIALRKDNSKLTNLFDNAPSYRRSEIERSLRECSGLLPLVNFSEWKIAISTVYPHVNGVKEAIYSKEDPLSNTHSRVSVKDELLSASFEYCLDLFWQAKEEANLQGEWGIVNPTVFLQWATKKGYTVEEFGINIYSHTDEGIRSYYANFLGKDFSRITGV